jgi:FkbM family methyltransferase
MYVLKELLTYLRQLTFLRQSSVRIFFEGHQITVGSRHSLIKLQLQEPFRHQTLKLASKFFLSDQKNHVIDVGANVGDTAIIIKSGSVANTFFTLVEPSPFFLYYLNQNANVIGNCEVVCSFVSPNFPIIELSADLQYWGGTALLVKSKSKTITVSEQVSLHELERQNTGLVKIDCDGQDFDILLNYLNYTKEFPSIYFENDIKNENDLLKALEVLKLASAKGYGLVSVSSCDGLLIWSGELNIDSLKDILQYQLNLAYLNASSRLAYTDVLLVQKSDFNKFIEFEKELRKLQENHFWSNKKLG